MDRDGHRKRRDQDVDEDGKEDEKTPKRKK